MGKLKFFQMMREIGEEMNKFSSILKFSDKLTDTPLRVLDLCFAPGGFSSTVMDLNQRAIVRGTTLPPSLGGHEVLFPQWETHPRLRIKFCDLTMRAGEMGIDPTTVPEEHPDRSNFDYSMRLFTKDAYGDDEADEPFNLIICDGQVLRTHAYARAEYRENCEAARLTLSQLIIGLQRLQGVGDNGRMVILLHRPDALDTAFLLWSLSTFARIKLFKPRVKHAVRSSFYVLATKIRVNSDEAVRAIDGWKEDWTVATFGTEEEWEARRIKQFYSLDVVEDLINKFGQELVRLAEPIWRIQARKLKKAQAAWSNPTG